LERFVTSFGDQLLQELPAASPAGRSAAAISQGVNALLQLCQSAGFITAWTLRYDPDLAELWEGRLVRSLQISVILYGDPFAAAQVLMAERGQEVPIPSTEIVRAWLRQCQPPLDFSATSYYVDMRYNADSTSWNPEQIQLELTVQ